MLQLRSQLPTFALFLLCGIPALCGISGCDSLPIDPYETFNIVRSADFDLASSAVTGKDTSLTATVAIDTVKDYSTNNHTTASLLKSSEVTRVILHSSDPAFSLDHFVYASLVIGADTVAFDSIPAGTGQDFPLTPKNVDVTRYLRSSSFTAALDVKLASPVSQPVTVTATFTIVHTGTRP